MNNQFHYSNFFENTGLFKELLDKYQYPWEVISDIDKFIESFDQKYQEASYIKLRDGLYIGQNVKIDNTSKIVGNGIIGHNSTIGHAAFLRGGILIGDGVHVGHATEVKHSIVLANSALAHLNYVGDSILGSNINLSGGATLANWRFDKEDVFVRSGDEKISTNIKKFGSIIGDNSFIGVNAVLNPGTILAKGTLVYPLTMVKGSHLDRETIK